MHPVVETWIEAAGEAGIPHNEDLNGATQDGAGRYQVTQRDGRRCSAAVAYLHPAAARGNVDVLTDARVYRILFEGERAVGVEYMRHGGLEEIRAEREVILAAGSYHSPQLLMLSGVGPGRPAEPARDRAAPRAAGGAEPAGPRDAELRLPDRQGQPRSRRPRPRRSRSTRARGAGR